MYKDYVGEASKRQLLHLRDYLLKETLSHVERHQEERCVGIAPTALTETQMLELMGYRMRLRDIEKHPQFPRYSSLPPVPAFCDIGTPLSHDRFERSVYQTAFSNLSDDVNAERQAARGVQSA
ncbi:hypothetical protein EOS_33060 [Caballeronia mineralivorans PML1(12)]|uniref:Uncharacterized protein n=1 Tax=Caballeronia mineralivorans PML1(12) TaxID=908627 RepID=A0A0J1FQE4_9BURK|nr:hypothetical protein [Caballeronia mineralivorans]KLU21973.1 hypothetical protein EOS_33060 [Caballeronia mineralivorans PML1(12)]